MAKLLLVSVVVLSLLSESMQQGGRPVKMSFKPPPMSEEMEHSQHVPGTMDCEACAGIAHQITLGLRNMHHNIYPKHVIKPESTLIETLDKICSQTTFEGYGPKGIGGEAKLSGPGLDASDEAGMMMGGGKWPTRMATRCNEYRGEIEEAYLYELAVEEKSQDMLNELCYSELTPKLQSCLGGRDKSLRVTKPGSGVKYDFVDPEELERPQEDIPMAGEEGYDEL